MKGVKNNGFPLLKKQFGMILAKSYLDFSSLGSLILRTFFQLHIIITRANGTGNSNYFSRYLNLFYAWMIVMFGLQFSDRSNKN